MLFNFIIKTIIKKAILKYLYLVVK